MKELIHLQGEGKSLFGGASNSYYSTPDRRQIVVIGYENVEGKFAAALWTARYIPSLKETVKDWCEYQSPIFTDQREMGEWCTEVFNWAIEHMNGQVTNPEAVVFPKEKARWSLCPECDHLDTLKVDMQAYGNLTTCNNPECDYEDYHSIGD